MKTGVFVRSKPGKEFIGVKKKAANQISALSTCFDMYEVMIEKENTSILGSIGWRLPGGSWGAKYSEALSHISDIAKKTSGVDFFYVRNRPLDRRYVEFLKALHTTYPDAKVIVEFPAYPNFNEYIRSSSMWPWVFKESFHSHHFRDYVDKVITYTDHKKIYGVSTIKTMNGIIVDKVEYKKTGSDDTVNIIAVASMQKHHGYERIIKGLRSYIRDGGNRKIKLHLVGEGPQNAYYNKLVDEYGLTDLVVFWGNKSGEDLENLYGIADIGLGSLGFHLIGAEKKVSSTLKTREYLAHGLPFVSACVEDVFQEYPDNLYYKRFPDDDTEISIGDVIEFYDGLLERYDGDSDSLRKSIHDFAKDTIDMVAVMKPVIDYIEKE